MSDKLYQVAVILTIPAENYDAATTAALEIGQALSIDAGVGVEVVLTYEHDGSEENQRVVYLPSETEPTTLAEEEASQCPT